MKALPAAPESGSVIKHADALDWPAPREPGTATAIVFDPPYAVGTPVRGREDGAAGSVSGPLSFMPRTMSLCARALRPGGIVVIFTDYRRIADMGWLSVQVRALPGGSRPSVAAEGRPPGWLSAWFPDRPRRGRPPGRSGDGTWAVRRLAAWA